MGTAFNIGILLSLSLLLLLLFLLAVLLVGGTGADTRLDSLGAARLFALAVVVDARRVLLCFAADAVSTLLLVLLSLPLSARSTIGFNVLAITPCNCPNASETTLLPALSEIILKTFSALFLVVEFLL